MKKLIMFLILMSMTVYAATVVYQPGTSGESNNNSDVMYCYVYETDGDVNDFTTDEFTIGNCILDRIVVDANGTDTSFKLYLYDCGTTYHDATIWSKTDCSTASMPVSQPITMTDGSNVVGGVPCSGVMKITLADGDDATLDRLEMFVYYRRR